MRKSSSLQELTMTLWDTMTALAGLRGAVDTFFDTVTVNIPDKPALRLNRLRLLNQIRIIMDKVADFLKIEGGH